MGSLPIISRDEALQRGLTRYFTGQPCGRGHVAPRYTKPGGRCIQCCRERGIAARARHQNNRSARPDCDPDAPLSVITRSAAARLGLRHFYTGRPCRRGHDVERLVVSGACTECERIGRAGSRRVIVDRVILGALEERARERGRTTDQLVRWILKVIIVDDILPAVLDR